MLVDVMIRHGRLRWMLIKICDCLTDATSGIIVQYERFAAFYRAACNADTV